MLSVGAQMEARPQTLFSTSSTLVSPSFPVLPALTVTSRTFSGNNGKGSHLKLSELLPMLLMFFHC